MRRRKFLCVVMLVLGFLSALPEAEAQGDGPRAYLLSPVGMNVFAPTYLDLSSNFNFAQDILIKDADISSEVGVATYIHYFNIRNSKTEIAICNIIWS